VSFGVVLSIVLVGALVLLVGSRMRRYGRLFATGHYRELADRLPAARTRALECAEEDGELALDDPRVIFTSAGLAVFVTIRREADVFVHHASVSTGAYTTQAVGRTFMVFVAERLGWEFDGVRFTYSPQVFHAEMVLDADGQRAWAGRVVEGGVADDVHARAMRRGQELEFAALMAAQGQ